VVKDRAWRPKFGDNPNSLPRNRYSGNMVWYRSGCRTADGL